MAHNRKRNSFRNRAALGLAWAGTTVMLTVVCFLLLASRGAKAVRASDSVQNTMATASQPLHLEAHWTLHGSVIEVEGASDSGAAVMINGEEIAGMEPDGRFSYFLPPREPGEYSVTVTAQTNRGRVATKILQVTVQ